MVIIEVNGRELKAKAGALLIDVADEAGIAIPRFCFHNKLSVSANCRMCMVEVEKVPRPLPSCATTVTDGMKVFTRSPMALAAQKDTMEFLLINHPLDCPVCDQGGECELQDVAMGYGRGISRFVEGKRMVPEADIGPLIATNFTRCIHCTRCIRFGAEIAGIREIGATGRGEYMTIGTYIEKSVNSELSGNMIDLCPVGSLTSKPFQFTARAWELVQHDGIAPHDSVGSNIRMHVCNNRVMRVHPKNNEAINECWISDRDRFSYQGLYTGDRLTKPLIKKGGEWNEANWEEALEFAAKGLRQARGEDGDRIGALLSPASTLEELYLAQKLMRGLGSDHVDVRLRQADFRGTEPAFPWLGQTIRELETLDAALLIGSNLRKEQPILGHRLRKAVRGGAQVTFINPLRLDLNYRAVQWVSSPAGMVTELAAVAKSLGASGGLMDRAEVGENHKALAEQLKGAERATVLLGNLAQAHPDYAVLRSLAATVAEASGARLGYLPEAANSVGARVAGALPDAGLNARTMLEQQRNGYLLLGIEPGYDLWNPAQAQQAFAGADFVVALSAYRSDSLEVAADVILPMAAFAETSGTYINAEGTRQSFAGAVTPLGEARPGWKILRVLGNLLDVEGFEQMSSEEVLAEVAGGEPDNSTDGSLVDECQTEASGLMRIGDVPLYAVDPLVRHASALQQTLDALTAAICINEVVAGSAGLVEGDRAVIVQDGGRAELPVVIDPGVPDGCVRVCAGLAGTENLGGQFGEVTLEKV